MTGPDRGRMAGPDRGSGRLPGALVLPLALFTALGGTACDAPPELQPDQVLRDSLGLTDRDRVYQVRVVAQDGVEGAEPAETFLRPGDYLNFRNGDRRARSIRFVPDDLTAEARAWIESAAGQWGTLLAQLGDRWVVDFSDAPLGRYPFEVRGGGETGRGVIVVQDG